MKAPEKIQIECTPGACIVHIIDEDGMVIRSEKYLMNKNGEIRLSGQTELRSDRRTQAIREKIAEATPGLFALSKLLHKIEDESFGGAIVEFS